MLIQCCALTGDFIVEFFHVTQTFFNIAKLEQLINVLKWTELCGKHFGFQHSYIGIEYNLYINLRYLKEFLSKGLKANS